MPVTDLSSKDSLTVVSACTYCKYDMSEFLKLSRLTGINLDKFTLMFLKIMLCS